jgi:uncharacterized protein YqfA (UPF0365 family)
MRYATVSRGDCNVFQLDVHVVFGYFEVSRCLDLSERGGRDGKESTFEKFAAIDLAGRDFEGNDMALE